MEEHNIVKLSKLLKEKHVVENNIDMLKERQIRKAVEENGVDYDTFLRIKDSIKKAGKEDRYLQDLELLKDQKTDMENKFYDAVAKSTRFMLPNEDGTYSVKLADCTVKYMPKPKYSVVQMNDEQKMRAVQTILNNQFYEALEINEDAYMKLNDLLKEQTTKNGGRFQNCPGIVDRDFFLKEEFSVRKSARKNSLKGRGD